MTICYEEEKTMKIIEAIQQIQNQWISIYVQLHNKQKWQAVIIDLLKENFEDFDEEKLEFRENMDSLGWSFSSMYDERGLRVYIDEIICDLLKKKFPHKIIDFKELKNQHSTIGLQFDGYSILFKSEM